MWNDFRFALRTLRRSPGFTLVAVISLALGIGANTAIFSLLYQVVLRSVPVRDPHSLVALASDEYSFGRTRRDNNQSVYSYPMYKALRDRNQVFTGLIARSSFPAALAYRGDAVRTWPEVVTGNSFQVLGVNPALGRLLIPSDDAPGQNPVIVLSYSYWLSHLGADPNVVNSQMLMNGHPVSVVGVAPRGFRGLLPGRDPEFFVPLSMMSIVSPGWKMSDAPDNYWLNVFGRLKPDVSEQRANAMLLPLFRSVLREELAQFSDVTENARKKILGKTLFVQSAAQGLNALRDQWKTPLTVLTVMVGLVLLIACANVANLLIARAAARKREVAVRLAMGASRWQLARLLMVESAVLAAGGGVLGMVLSLNLTQGLLSLLPADATGGWLTARVDTPLLIFGTVLALLTALLFSVAPVFNAAKTDPAPALKAQTSGMSSSGSQSRARQGLVAVQICISLLLLVGAGLFTGSLVNLLTSDPGFQTDHLVTFSIDPSLSGYTPASRSSLLREVRERMNSLPGVKSTAMAQLIPLAGWGWGNGVKVPGSRIGTEEYVNCNENAVGSGYFATLGIPLLAGRDFSEQDTATSPKVAILSQTFAHVLFDNANPIGRQIIFGAENSTGEIVGIVKDSRYNDLREKPPNFLYVPFEQGGESLGAQASFFLRTAGREQNVLGMVRRAMKQLDPNVPVEPLTSMKVIIDESISTERLIAMLGIAFGVLASILAAVGLYGTISYSVARRTREFGIRLAMGAVPKGLLWSVLREAAWLTAIGVAVGLPASYLLARLVESELYGIDAHDVWVLAGATVLIAIVALLAGLAPAVRAMRIEPVQALRYE